MTQYDIAAQVGDDYATVYYQDAKLSDAFTIPHINQDGLELLGTMIERHNAHSGLVNALRNILRAKTAPDGSTPELAWHLVEDARAALAIAGDVEQRSRRVTASEIEATYRRVTRVGRGEA